MQRGTLPVCHEDAFALHRQRVQLLLLLRAAVLCASQYMVVNMLMHSMFSTGGSFQVFAMSQLTKPLWALSGQDSIEALCTAAALTNRVLMPTKRHDQPPGFLTLWSLQGTKH